MKTNNNNNRNNNTTTMNREWETRDEWFDRMERRWSKVLLAVLAAGAVAGAVVHTVAGQWLNLTLDGAALVAAAALLLNRDDD